MTANLQALINSAWYNRDNCLYLSLANLSKYDLWTTSLVYALAYIKWILLYSRLNLN